MKEAQRKYIIAFGDRLRILLERERKTPEDVAAHGEIETKQVYRVLNGEHSTTLSVLYSIAKGLGVHPKELFDFKFKED